MEIDIPFGAKDSELKGWGYKIPEGYTAEIKDGEVIVKSTESEDERIATRLIHLIHTGGYLEEPSRTQILSWLEKQRAKERLDRMAPIYNDKESFESALEKAWKYYNESASRKVDSFEDDYIECVFSKGFREGFLYKEKQEEQRLTLKFKVGDKIHLIDGTSPNYEDDCITIREIGTVNYLGEFKEGYVPIKEQDKWELVKEQKPTEIKIKGKEYLSGLLDGKCLVLEHPEKYDLYELTEWSEDIIQKAVKEVGLTQHQINWFKTNVFPPKQEWSEEDKKIAETICKEGDLKPSEKRWLKSLPERFNLQPKQEWSSEDEDFINMLILHFNYLIDKGGDSVETYKSYIEKLKSLRPQPKYGCGRALINGEPIPTENQSVDIPLAEWSEGDEINRQIAIGKLEGTEVALEWDVEQRVIKWLKSLRPQPYKEVYQAAKHDLAIKFMNYLDENRPEGKMCLSNGECEDIDKAFKENDWVKIMRYVEKYRPHWKPSEEQLRALQMAVDEHWDVDGDALYSLYTDLKKLKKLKKL